MEGCDRMWKGVEGCGRMWQVLGEGPCTICCQRTELTHCRKDSVGVVENGVSEAQIKSRLGLNGHKANKRALFSPREYVE
jgi:hypothetical protein